MLIKYQVKAFKNWNPRQSKNNYLEETQTHKMQKHARYYPLTKRVSSFLRSFSSEVAEHQDRESMNDLEEKTQTCSLVETKSFVHWLTRTRLL